MSIIPEFVKNTLKFTGTLLVRTGTVLERYSILHEGISDCGHSIVETRKESHQIVIPVAGVTFEGRQDIIRELHNLTYGDSIVITSISTKQYPYRIQVKVGNNVVGYVPDKKDNSVSESFYRLWKQGYVIKPVSMVKVTGKDGIYGLRLTCIVER